MKKLTILAIALVTLTVSTAAFALDLTEARRSGAVGERLDGYVEVLKSSPDASALAAEVNARRKQEYARISAANSQPVAVVAKLAAEQVINNLPAGSLYQSPSGDWVKK